MRYSVSSTTSTLRKGNPMEIKSARNDAQYLLEKIIQTQPELITPKKVNIGANGKMVADFCSEFIETFAAYLVSRDEKTGSGR